LYIFFGYCVLVVAYFNCIVQLFIIPQVKPPTKEVEKKKKKKKKKKNTNQRRRGVI